MQTTTPIPILRSSNVFRQDVYAFRSCHFSTADLQKLHEYLQRPDLNRLPLDAHALRHKFRMARLGESASLDGVVGITSCAMWCVDDDLMQTGILRHRTRIGSPAGVIPVCSESGAALIRMSAGDSITYMRQNCTIGQLKILRAVALT